MGLTYFRRYRMRCDLTTCLLEPPPLSPGYRLAPYRSGLVNEHAKVKFESFADGLDTFVFQCLARQDGCLRLMREIVGRQEFCEAATWLIYYEELSPEGGMAAATGPPGTGPLATGPLGTSAVGTVQGLSIDDVGSIQNLGIHPHHRGRGLGSLLMHHAAVGFRSAGLKSMQLEVTSDNVGAVRLYERLGFTIDEVVYKAAEVAG